MNMSFEEKLFQSNVASIVVGVIVASVVGGIGVVVITNTLAAAGVTGGLWSIIYLLIPTMVIMAIVGAFALLTR
jgi:hypothetical protein